MLRRADPPAELVSWGVSWGQNYEKATARLGHLYGPRT